MSKPNSCKGCPIAKMVPLAAKVANICDKIVTGYEVQYILDDHGGEICRVIKIVI